MQYWNLKSVTKTVRRLNNGQKILFTAAWTAPHGFCYHGTKSDLGGFLYLVVETYAT